MSNAERPEFRALEDLEEVGRRISEELTAFRRRAKKAEAERAELGGDVGDPESARSRISGLELENEELRARVEHARARVSELLSRLRFLEEQMSTEQASS